MHFFYFIPVGGTGKDASSRGDVWMSLLDVIEDAIRRSTAAPSIRNERSEVCSTIPSTVASCRCVNRNFVSEAFGKFLKYVVCCMLCAVCCMLGAVCGVRCVVCCVMQAGCCALCAGRGVRCAVFAVLSATYC